MIETIQANALHIPLPDKSVQCVVTSPPYWGLRDYGVGGQLGMEATPEEYVATMVAVFREVWRVMGDDGTLWLNLGDTYAGSWGAMSYLGGSIAGRRYGGRKNDGNVSRPVNSRVNGILKAKDMVGIPWRVAFALQADGWYLRSDIIWHKPNPMPESVTDRPTKSHEYLFLMTKSERYYYDAEAIMESCSESTNARISQDLINQVGTERANGGKKSNGNLKAVVKGSTTLLNAGVNPKAAMMDHGGSRQNASFSNAVCLPVLRRNKRSVWTVTTQGYSGAHFATFPPALVEPCILAGSRRDDLVIDPFSGTGTVGQVAAKHGRHYVGIELKREYIDLATERLHVLPVMLPGI